MKTLSILLLFAVSSAFAFVPCGCKSSHTNKIAHPNTPAPLVYKELPYRFLDKSEPIVLVENKPQVKVIEHIQEVEEPEETEEQVPEETDFETCIKQCVSENTTSSFIEFCIKEKCSKE